MNLRTALANIHRDPFWWRKILIGGALMLTIVGYPFAAGMVVESIDNSRKGFPTPLPLWRDWSLRYIIGLFALIIDMLFFALPIFGVALGLLCIGVVAIADDLLPPKTIYVGLGLLALYEFAIFAASVSPVGRLLFAESGRAEDALSMKTVRAAFTPPARREYLWARLLSLPAYVPFLILAAASWFVDGPLRIVMLWFTLSALLYAHLVVGQLYVAAEKAAWLSDAA